MSLILPITSALACGYFGARLVGVKAGIALGAFIGSRILKHTAPDIYHKASSIILEYLPGMEPDPKGKYGRRASKVKTISETQPFGITTGKVDQVSVSTATFAPSEFINKTSLPIRIQDVADRTFKIQVLHKSPVDENLVKELAKTTSQIFFEEERGELLSALVDNHCLIYSKKIIECLKNHQAFTWDLSRPKEIISRTVSYVFNNFKLPQFNRYANLSDLNVIANDDLSQLHKKRSEFLTAHPFIRDFQGNWHAIISGKIKEQFMAFDIVGYHSLNYPLETSAEKRPQYLMQFFIDPTQQGLDELLHQRYLTTLDWKIVKPGHYGEYSKAMNDRIRNSHRSL